MQTIPIENNTTKQRFRRPKQIGAIVLFGVLLALSGLLWLRLKNRFPIVDAGSWTGEITEVFDEDIPFYVDRGSTGDTLIVSVMQKGLFPIQVHFAELGATSPEFESSRPLVIKTDKGELVLTGGSSGPSRYAGTAAFPSGVRGHWELRPTISRSPRADDDAIKLWLSLKEELAENDRRIAAATARAAEQQAELDRMSKFVSEDGKLKANAEEKYNEVRQELTARQTQLKQKQEEIRKLEEQLSLAQRVTPMGRLVSLSRDSLERENRWIDSILRTSSNNQSSPELDEELKRGARIITLREAIAAEKRRHDEAGGGL